jgi:hypothetical protein
MGSGGSRSLWPPGKLFEDHEAAAKTAAASRASNPVEVSVSTPVAFAMDHSIGISPLVVRPLEVIWSSLTGN